MDDAADLVEREFPIKRKTVYLNNASYTPMFNSAISVISEKLRDYSLNGPDDQYYIDLKHHANTSRRKLSKLLNVKSDTIVFAASATHAINMVANGFRFRKGDVIISRGRARTEHPSNYLPWQYYAGLKGLEIVDIPVDAAGIPEISAVDSMLKATRAKLLVTSHVLYNLGTIMPAREMARVAHERGARFFLDAAQSVGNIDVDLKAIDCDFAGGTASKWLCGPLGLGFFYCKAGALESLDPTSFGANATDYTSNTSYKILPTAGRFQEGFRNWAYVYGLGEALDLWGAVGLEKIQSTNMGLARQIVERLSGMRKKYNVLADFEDGRRTGIVPVESLESSPDAIVRRVLKKNVTISQREIGDKKILRISPHFYNDEKELQRLYAVL